VSAQAFPCEESRDMATEQTTGSVIYHGFWRKNSTPVIVIEDEHGHQTSTVRHLPKHSPTGMNWGYAGAGPTDTARTLLIAALGEDAICPLCAGTGRVVYVRDEAGQTLQAQPFNPDRHPWARRGWICECDEGYRQLPYSRFVSQYVTQWGAEWTMSRTSILDWLSTTGQIDPALSGS
jgi:hypothetical protein